MKILHFFITKIFLKRWILVLSMVALLFLANSLSFIAARSIISTFQGYQDVAVFNQEGNFIANLDPDHEAKFDKIDVKDTQKLYDYLNDNYTYAFQADGFGAVLDNEHDMELSFSYINEDAYRINQYELSEGNDLYFDYQVDENQIPVLVGAGLASTYPVGSTIETMDPVTQRVVNLNVQGVLEKNTHRSNFYAPDSKNYFNFAILLPVNEQFIQRAGLDLHVNGLMDLVLLDSTKEEAADLNEYVQENIGLKLNFFSQQENFDYFEAYYANSIKIICAITFVLLVILVGLATWTTLTSVRLMIKEFTINLLVGLSYSKLRTIFYSYFGMLFSVILAVLFIVIAFNRYGYWIRKDAVFATYGLFGLISMDWLALLMVLLINLMIGLTIVELTLRKIKRIPISVGVLQ
ncbi:ABC transporter permease [Exiguobacterium sp. SL-10]|uniref:ABC transporter permease n=1 Tax=unclassified Exiguobacterium TaxID=2644629 RepID=UPI00103A4D8B|nr:MULTISPECIES: ABC transporter permease [unclassified Exiguobacterium]TCI21661.1 ABC transporter permease [Exiguobacterium sp. SL-9]TCI29704.1 ABC transporter permease [Exiguobacterium sp. SL-10]